MESNDYAKRILDIKNEIVEEIRKLVPEDNAHRFSDKFYVHYIEGEVATTEVCSAVEVWCGGMVVFIVNHLKEFAKEEVIEGEAIYRYEPESFLDILDHLKKEVREKKLQTLREIVDNNDHNVGFDGKFRFTGIAHFEDGSTFEHEECYLDKISIENGTLIFHNTEENSTHNNTEEFLSDDELDRIIEYVKLQVKPKFSIRAAETRSRTFEFYTGSYEEALALAKKELEANPLNEEDSDGLFFS